MSNKFTSSERPMLYYPPSISDKVQVAYDRRDWKTLNSLAVVWWCPYAERWFKFSPTSWDA